MICVQCQNKATLPNSFPVERNQYYAIHCEYMITTTQISYGKEELEAECLAHMGVRSNSQTLFTHRLIETSMK